MFAEFLLYYIGSLFSGLKPRACILHPCRVFHRNMFGRLYQCVIYGGETSCLVVAPLYGARCKRHINTIALFIFVVSYLIRVSFVSNSR